MRSTRLISLAVVAIALLTSAGLAQQPGPDGPYRILKTARVGGEGGWDYIYADAASRRLYIPRGATRGTPATDTTPAVPPSVNRITVFNLDTLDPVGDIPDTGGNGVTICPNTGHGFSTSHPAISMFDTKTLTLIKKIDLAAGASGDGLYCDPFNDRVYIFSHPTKDATVIDAKDGTVLGVIGLGGVPEQGVADGNGTLYVVMQDRPGSVAVVDVKTMKTTAHYPFGDNGRCNGLTLDGKNRILFAACAATGPAPAAQSTPTAPPAAPAPLPQPMMVILKATDGTILTKLPLAGGSDGAAFNPATMEAFSSHGNGTLTVVKEKSPTTFEVEQNLQTMNGARTITLDSGSDHLFVMSQEYGAPPAPTTPPAAGGRGGGRGPAIPGSFTILMIGR
ncbi:MAG: hypothetical protein ABIS06_01390 [Vicinamibacterales bacterium]